MIEKPKPPQPAPPTPVTQLDLEQRERELKQQLEQHGKNPRDVLWQLAQLYNATKRPEHALQCLRQILAVEPDLEIKAACVLTLGQTMERLNDFPAAINFYREAKLMEPARNDTWYFIHNNLGYSYNQIGRFAEGENCCRRAIQINPARPNGHKNLGIALAAQGKYREAALCYITGTFNHAGDGRSFTLLKELVKEHPELGFDFQKQIDRCEKLVNFAVLAIGRARAGQPMKVLLGLGKSEWLNLCGHTLKAISGGAVAIQVAENLSQFTEIAGGKNFELGFLAPGILPTGPTDIEATVSWERAILTVSQIKAQQPMAIILVGTKADGARHQADCKASGVAAVLEANNQTDALVEATIHLLTPS